MAKEPVLVLDAPLAELDARARGEGRSAREALCARRDAGDVGFLDLPADRTCLPEIAAAAGRFRDRYDRLVVAGDDGAARAAGVPAASFAPRPGGLAVLDLAGAGPARFAAEVAAAPLERTAFLFVGRRGDEAPARERYEGIRARLRVRFGGGWRERVAIVTDPADGALREEAARAGVTSFPLHENVPGELALLGAAGLFPAACAGADPEALLDGALRVRDRFDDPGDATDPGSRLGTVLWLGRGRPAPEAERPALGAAAAWFARLWSGGGGPAVPVRLGTGDAPAPAGGAAVLVPGLDEGGIGALLQILVIAAAMGGAR